MRFNLKKFEEFTQDTITNNNSEYSKFLSSSKSSHQQVGWDKSKYQIKNFKLVANAIENGDSLLDFGCGLGDFIGYLEKRGIKLSNYSGVDINEDYIKLAKEKYPNNDFKLINNVDQISGKWDVICAIGVFTWYINKDEFIKTIRKLYESCNKCVLITVLDAGFLGTPYDDKDYSKDQEEKFWSRKYRYYNAKLFAKLFPDLWEAGKFSFDHSIDTLLVKISK